MGYGIDAFGYLAGPVCQDESFLVNRRPFRGNAMQVPPLGKEFPTYGMGRYNNLGTLIDAQEVLQASGMVAMSVGDKHIVHCAEVDIHLLGITDKDITGPGIQQDPVPFCL